MTEKVAQIVITRGESGFKIAVMTLKETCDVQFQFPVAETLNVIERLLRGEWELT